MTERKQVCVSMSDEIIEMLKAVEKDTGLKRSVVIQELIRKAYTDEITRKIITNENYKRIVAKKMDGSTHNVHCVNQKENGSEGPYQTDPNIPANGTLILSEINGQKAINGLIIPNLFRNLETFQKMTIEKQYETLKYYYEHK